MVNEVSSASSGVCRAAMSNLLLNLPGVVHALIVESNEG